MGASRQPEHGPPSGPLPSKGAERTLQAQAEVSQSGPGKGGARSLGRRLDLHRLLAGRVINPNPLCFWGNASFQLELYSLWLPLPPSS